MLQHQIHNWRQAQLIYTPHAATLIAAASPSTNDNDGPSVEIIENSPLFLPSSLPADVRAASDMERVCCAEKRLRIAQADDALVEIRRQRRIIQGLWQFKRINVSGTGNRPNTRMLTLYNRINHKIERAAQKYRTAWLALMVLDPDGAWKDRLKELRREDIRGPGRDLADTKTTNGRFEPSWIWLMPRAQSSVEQTEDEFNESMRVEWAKTRARSMRWQEEFEILQEEMRRVLAFFEWKALWWESQATGRKEGDSAVLHGVSAYALKQSHIARCMARRCAITWLPQLKEHGIVPKWADDYRVGNGDLDAGKASNANSSSAGASSHEEETGEDGVEDGVDDDDEIDVEEATSDVDNDSDDDYFEFDD